MNIGLVIYAQDLKKLALFYAEALEFNQQDFDDQYIRLTNGDAEIVILQVAEDYKTTQTSPRYSSAIKPVLFVHQPLSDIRKSVKSYGGFLKAEDCEWQFNHMNVCDGHDPEGNIFQIRSR